MSCLHRMLFGPSERMAIDFLLSKPPERGRFEPVSVLTIATKPPPTFTPFHSCLPRMASCKAIAPIVDDLATTYSGKLKVVKVNVDQNSATPSRYGIRGIPALLLFKGGKVADQIVGYVPREVIEEKVNRVLTSAPTGVI